MAKLTEEEQERLQEIMAQLNESEIAAETIRRHISELATSLTELSVTIGTIKKLKELKQETDILVPIGADSFVPAKITQCDKVVTGLGADVAAEYKADDAIKLLETRAAELEQAIDQARAELERLEGRMETLRPEAEKILQKAREEPKE